MAQGWLSVLQHLTGEGGNVRKNPPHTQSHHSNVWTGHWGHKYPSTRLLTCTSWHDRAATTKKRPWLSHCSNVLSFCFVYYLSFTLLIKPKDILNKVCKGGLFGGWKCLQQSVEDVTSGQSNSVRMSLSCLNWCKSPSSVNKSREKSTVNKSTDGRVHP